MYTHPAEHPRALVLVPVRQPTHFLSVMFFWQGGLRFVNFIKNNLSLLDIWKFVLVKICILVADKMIFWEYSRKESKAIAEALPQRWTNEDPSTLLMALFSFYLFWFNMNIEMHIKCSIYVCLYICISFSRKQPTIPSFFFHFIFFLSWPKMYFCCQNVRFMRKDLVCPTPVLSLVLKHCILNTMLSTK